MLSKEAVSTLIGILATASVTAVGLAVGGPVGATVMGGIGLNLSSNIIQGGYFHLKDRWVHSENGILNHDVQEALLRAIVKALAALESKYLESAQAKNLKGYERESIKELFKELRESAQTNLPISFARTPLREDVWRYLVGLPDSNMVNAWDAMMGDDLLVAYGADFRDFIRQNLLNEVLFWFNEELKTDSKETNKAWRAFQRMLLEGIYADVKAVQGNQVLMSQDLLKLDALKGQLDKMQGVIDSRLPDELFQQELEDAVDTVCSTLQTIEEITKKTDHRVTIIHHDVRTLLGKQKKRLAPEVLRLELSQIRERLITAHSTWDLREALYRVEELLSDHPSAEAHQLKYQIETALSRETMMAPPEASAPGYAQRAVYVPTGHVKSMNMGCWTLAIAIGLIALALYLLYRWIL